MKKNTKKSTKTLVVTAVVVSAMVAGCVVSLNAFAGKSADQSARAFKVSDQLESDNTASSKLLSRVDAADVQYAVADESYAVDAADWSWQASEAAPAQEAVAEITEAAPVVAEGTDIVVVDNVVDSAQISAAAMMTAASGESAQQTESDKVKAEAKAAVALVLADSRVVTPQQSAAASAAKVQPAEKVEEVQTEIAEEIQTEVITEPESTEPATTEPEVTEPVTEELPVVIEEPVVLEESEPATEEQVQEIASEIIEEVVEFSEEPLVIEEPVVEEPVSVEEPVIEEPASVEESSVAAEPETVIEIATEEPTTVAEPTTVVEEETQPALPQIEILGAENTSAPTEPEADDFAEPEIETTVPETPAAEPESPEQPSAEIPSEEETEEETEEVLDATKIDYPPLTYNAAVGQAVVDYAYSRVGVTPYVWAGNSLEEGTDCSGFVHLIYEMFGYYAPRGSDVYQDWANINYEDLMPGDVVVYRYGGHVAIYAGNDTIIHASNEIDGTKVSDMWYDNPTAYVRIAE